MDVPEVGKSKGACPEYRVNEVSSVQPLQNPPKDKYLYQRGVWHTDAEGRFMII